MEKALVKISERLGFVQTLEELKQITEVSDREIEAYSLLLTIADNLVFDDFWELPFELDLGSKAIYDLITHILALRISKKRKSRKELLQLIEKASEREASRLDKIKRLFGLGV